MRLFGRKKDSSHRTVVAAFKALGCSVVAIESAVAGVPDLGVGCAGRTRLVEVKPDSHLKAHAASAAQQRWAGAWKGGCVSVVRSAKEAAELVNLWRLEAANADRAAQLLKREMDETLAKVNG